MFVDNIRMDILKHECTLLLFYVVNYILLIRLKDLSFALNVNNYKKLKRFGSDYKILD